MYAQKAGEWVLSILCPGRCPVCHGIAPKKAKICPECRSFLPYIETKRCRKCGKPVEDDVVFCRDCEKNPHLYDEGIGIFRYDVVMRESISYFKYKGRREYGEIYGTLITEAARDKLDRWRPDVIIPIPVHKKRLRERGYNQAEVISERVAVLTGIPHEPNALVRTEKTTAMKRLGASERAANLKGAFRVSSDFRPVRNVLLIDDIYTTGATIDAAAAVLRSAGCTACFFLTVCIGSGFMVEY